MNLDQILERYIRDKSTYCSPKTLQTYRGHILIFWKYLRETYKQDPGQMDFVDFPSDDNLFQGFILYLRSKATRSVTIRSYARSVKGFLRWCYEEDFCCDYLKKVKLPKDDSTPQLPLLADEADKLDSCFDLRTVKGIRNWLIVHLMLDCGLRSQEVRRLAWEDLDPERNLLQIRTSKGEKSRITLIPDFVIVQIREYLRLDGRSGGIILCSFRGGEPLTENAIKQLYADLKVQSGLPRLHAHLLRHTFATSYLIGGGNMEFLRVFLGHTDYAVMQTYTNMAAQCRMLRLQVYALDPLFFERGY